MMDEEMRADVNAIYDKIDAYYDREEARRNAYYEGMIAIIKEIFQEAMEFCRAVTPVCLEEEKESAPEKPESVAEPKEVPERATEQETGEDAEDRTGELRLAVRRRRQRKKRAQENGGPRQKFAAFRRRFTRRAVPALLKGHVLKGPRRNRRSGVRKPGKTFRSRMGGRSLKKRRTKFNTKYEREG
jgi:hypothetical protein